jgi:hypothetical protein
MYNQKSSLYDEISEIVMIKNFQYLIYSLNFSNINFNQADTKAFIIFLMGSKKETG